jgi:hypothetical protein
MAKKKQMLLQMEMFDEMSRNSLSPNQYYVMCCIRDSVTPVKINLHMELRTLKTEGWIDKIENKHILLPKAVSLISIIEKLFSIQKKKTTKQLLGEKSMEKILKYNEIFPKKKLESGRAARSAPKNVEKAFRWFFQNHEYSWETIFKATKIYRNEQLEDNNDKYLKTSQYFIRKSEESRLADYCYSVETDGFDGERVEMNHTITIV